MFNYTHLTCALTLSAIGLSAQVAPAPIPAQTSGIVAIADSQTAQLNLLNPGARPPATGVICSVSVAFVDANGTVLKSGSIAVAPGKSVPFDLRSDTDLQLLAGDRREIRATISLPVVTPPSAAATVASPCNLFPTLEIFDTVSGRTLVTLGRFETISPAPSTNP